MTDTDFTLQNGGRATIGITSVFKNRDGGSTYVDISVSQEQRGGEPGLSIRSSGSDLNSEQWQQVDLICTGALDFIQNYLMEPSDDE